MTPRGMLRSAKKPLTIGFSIGVIAACLTLLMPNRYTSVARILPSDGRGTSAMGLIAAAAASAGVSVPGQTDDDSNYLDILRSRWLGEQLLLKTYEFNDRTWRFGHLQFHQETLQHYMGARNIDQGILMMTKYVKTTKDIKSKLLTISVETSSPALSQQIAQEMVRLLDSFVVQQSEARGRNKADFAQKRLEEARAEAQKAEDSFHLFLNSNRNYQSCPDPAIRLKGKRLEDELSLRTQIATTLATTLEQALLEEKNDTAVLNVLDHGNLPQEKSGPHRALIVLALFLLGSFFTWILENWTLINNLITSSTTKPDSITGLPENDPT
nr:hypothetical protein [uncultured Holophaga sp.]